MTKKALHPPKDGGHDAPGTGQVVLDQPETKEDKMNIINPNTPIEKAPDTFSGVGDHDQVPLNKYQRGILKFTNTLSEDDQEIFAAWLEEVFNGAVDIDAALAEASTSGDPLGCMKKQLDLISPTGVWTI